MPKRIQPSKKKARLDLLNPQQQLFVQYLLADEKFNAAAAAKAAGYRSVTASASQLMNNKIIQNAIGKALSERLNAISLTANDVLKHLTTALFLDPLEFFTEDEYGTLTIKSLQDIPAHVRRCIVRMKSKTKTNPETEETETTFEIELMSKDKALELSLKHLGLLDERLHVTGQVTVEFLAKLRNHVEGHATVVSREAITDGIPEEN